MNKKPQYFPANRHNILNPLKKYWESAFHKTPEGKVVLWASILIILSCHTKNIHLLFTTSFLSLQMHYSCILVSYTFIISQLLHMEKFLPFSFHTKKDF